MKILVLESSPNRHGSSNMLAAEFIRGAKEARHRVQVVDVAHADIHPCSGCVACGYEGPCAQKDDMEQIRADILTSDMLVFVTPLYYCGMSAQLKILVDRFCAFNASLTAGRKKSALIAAAWNSDSWTFDALEAHYKHPHALSQPAGPRRDPRPRLRHTSDDPRLPFYAGGLRAWQKFTIINISGGTSSPAWKTAFSASPIP